MALALPAGVSIHVLAFWTDPVLSPQDYCGQNSTGSFSIITENVPCGTTGVTCSKAIKIFIGVSYCWFLGQENPGEPLDTVVTIFSSG